MSPYLKLTLLDLPKNIKVINRRFSFLCFGPNFMNIDFYDSEFFKLNLLLISAFDMCHEIIAYVKKLISFFKIKSLKIGHIRPSKQIKYIKFNAKIAFLEKKKSRTLKN